MKLKFKNSVYKAELSNSIYQQKGAGFGLNVSSGMMVNNRPDGQTGIAQAAMLKKAMKYGDKVRMIADGVALGDMKSDMMEGPEMD